MHKSYPLLDKSNGQMKGWPGGGWHLPDGTYIPLFRPVESGEQASAVVENWPGSSVMHCKYCYQDVQTLRLRETYDEQLTEMHICSECGAGLTSPDTPPQ